ncbi:Threonine/homoserine exporter RhtA [compost metagenome]
MVPFGVARAGTVLLDPALMLAGLGVGILSSAVPYSLEMVALKRLPQQTFGILLSMEPAIGALAALFILGEQLTLLQWLAIASIIVASVGSATSIRQAMPQAEPSTASD